MVREKDVCWEYAEKLEGNKVRCKFCQRVLNGGISRLKHHLSRLPSKGVNPCTKVRDDVTDRVRAIIAQKEDTKENSCVTKHKLTEARSTGNISAVKAPMNLDAASPILKVFPSVTPMAPPSLNNQENAEKSIALFFFENKLDFSVARSSSYQLMIEAIAKCGPGFTGPSAEMLKTAWLERIKSEVSLQSKDVEKEWSTTVSSATLRHTTGQGTSLTVEKPEEVLTSPNGVFSAGFHSVGGNAYCFAVWFNHPSLQSRNRTIVWMVNRDQPVNGRRSKLSLLKTGNLILTDAGKFTVWETNTLSNSSVQLSLNNTGNLVLHALEGVSLWESFLFPTDTLLPQQLLTRNTKLVSSRSQSTYSSGFYKLFFDNDNLLRLLYDGPESSSLYWFDPWLGNWDAQRSTYNKSRIAVLDSLGNFSSSDNFTAVSADYGAVLHRRLTIDYDGDIRVYSWKEEEETWVISWQAIQKPCTIHAICGANSICSYVAGSERKCSCLPGYNMKNHTDWSYGCEPGFDLSCNKNESGFLQLSHIQFYGYDYGYFPNYTLHECRTLCLQLCDCIAFQFTFFADRGYANCYPKTLLLNGYLSPDFNGDFYLRLPESNLLSYTNSVVEYSLDCPSEGTVVTTVKSRENGTLKFMLWFACGVGGLEIICIFLVWCLLVRTGQSSGADKQGYLAAVGFRKYTYAELKKATKGFSEEIGKGGGGIVYKGVLSDNRVAAIKRLNETNQGEGEFLAEVSIIGRINHMNLIEMWGYCAEGKHRLLVYEYMEHGSLAENLFSNSLDWKKRFEIAVGTAKGLAYLHEDCLEWVLHCDVKPQNILLDSNYQPKVADFGLSKLQNRGNLKNSSFSRIRGTRGYMAPEWVLDLPITSKVDVYSFGIVVLEMVTGKGPTEGVHVLDCKGETEHRRLVKWVRENRNRAATNAMTSWLEEMIDPRMKGKYEMGKMEALVRVALQCVDEDRDARPTMSQVIEMLFQEENVH